MSSREILPVPVASRFRLRKVGSGIGIAEMMKLKIAAIAAAAAITLSAGALYAQAPTPAPSPRPAKQSAPRAKPASPQAAPQPAPSTGKSLCVASAIGHKFNVQTIGLMVFGNALEEASIDSLVSRRRPRPQGHATDGPAICGAAAGRAEACVGGLRGPPGAFQGPQRRISSPASRAAAGGKCDRVLTATRGSSGYGGTNQTLYGLGVLNHGRPINERVYVFVTYDLVLYDGKGF